MTLRVPGYCMEFSLGDAPVTKDDNICPWFQRISPRVSTRVSILVPLTLPHPTLVKAGVGSPTRMWGEWSWQIWAHQLRSSPLRIDIWQVPKAPTSHHPAIGEDQIHRGLPGRGPTPWQPVPASCFPLHFTCYLFYFDSIILP